MTRAWKAWLAKREVLPGISGNAGSVFFGGSTGSSSLFTVAAVEEQRGGTRTSLQHNILPEMSDAPKERRSAYDHQRDE